MALLGRGLADVDMERLQLDFMSCCTDACCKAASLTVLNELVAFGGYNGRGERPIGRVCVLTD